MSRADESADCSSQSYLPRRCHQTTGDMAFASSEPASGFCVTPNTCHNAVSNLCYSGSILRLAESTESLVDSNGAVMSRMILTRHQRRETLHDSNENNRCSCRGPTRLWELGNSGSSRYWDYSNRPITQMIPKKSPGEGYRAEEENQTSHDRASSQAKRWR